MIHIGREEFVRLAGFIRRHSGIELAPGKEYLLETRLHSLLRERGFSSFSQLSDALDFSGAGELQEKVINAVSTRETLFFRDKDWFNLLRFKIFPDIIDFKIRNFSGAKSTLTVWSAGCSTGQEVYSVIMAFLETVRHRPGVGIRVLGSDISNEAVSRASYGEYSDFEVGRGLDSTMRNRYFQKVGTMWRVRDEVRALATFSRHNLLSDPMHSGSFDVVLCRNVGIYFSMDDRNRLFQRIRSSLQPPGYLLLGATESLGDDAKAGLVGRRHLNALYYVLDGQHDSPGTAVNEVATRETSRDLPACRAVRHPNRTSFSAGRESHGRRGVRVKEPLKHEYVPESVGGMPAVPASKPKRGLLATLHRESGEALLAKLRSDPGPGVLDRVREMGCEESGDKDERSTEM